MRLNSVSTEATLRIVELSQLRGDDRKPLRLSRDHLETIRRPRAPSVAALQVLPAKEQAAPASSAITNPVVAAAVEAVNQARARGEANLGGIAYRAAMRACLERAGGDLSKVSTVDVLEAVAIATGQPPPIRAGAPPAPPGSTDTRAYWDSVFASVPKADPPPGSTMAEWVSAILAQEGATFAVTAGATSFSAGQQHALHDAGVPLRLGESSLFIYRGEVYAWGAGNYWYTSALNDPAMHLMLASVLHDQIRVGAACERDLRVHDELRQRLAGTLV